VFDDDRLHRPRLLVGDVEIGVGHARQDERERGDEARPFLGQVVELVDDLAHGVRLGSVFAFLRGLATQAEKLEDRHRASVRTNVAL
jgi:hypothetical protein